jgi:hypothetical protein
MSEEMSIAIQPKDEEYCENLDCPEFRTLIQKINIQTIPYINSSVNKLHNFKELILKNDFEITDDSNTFFINTIDEAINGNSKHYLSRRRAVLKKNLDEQTYENIELKMKEFITIFITEFYNKLNPNKDPRGSIPPFNEDVFNKVKTILTKLCFKALKKIENSVFLYGFPNKLIIDIGDKIYYMFNHINF